WAAAGPEGVCEVDADAAWRASALEPAEGCTGERVAGAGAESALAAMVLGADAPSRGGGAKLRWEVDAESDAVCAGPLTAEGGGVGDCGLGAGVALRGADASSADFSAAAAASDGSVEIAAACCGSAGSALEASEVTGVDDADPGDVVIVGAGASLSDVDDRRSSLCNADGAGADRDVSAETEVSGVSGLEVGRAGPAAAESDCDGASSGASVDAAVVSRGDEADPEAAPWVDGDAEGDKPSAASADGSKTSAASAGGVGASGAALKGGGVMAVGGRARALMAVAGMASAERSAARRRRARRAAAAEA
ncbi:MAG: hypothetical protein AAF763_19045, partial [Pseudomonadota bacterium]